MKYRKLLLKELSTVGLQDPQSYLKALNIKQCISFLTQAWDELGTSVLIKSWRKLFSTYQPYVNLLSHIGDEWDVEDELPISQWVQRFSYDPIHWHEQNLVEEAALRMTDEDIIDQVKGISANDEVEDQDDSFANLSNLAENMNILPEEVPIATEEHVHAFKLLSALENYYQGQHDGKENEVVVRSLKSDLVNKINNLNI